MSLPYKLECHFSRKLFLGCFVLTVVLVSLFATSTSNAAEGRITFSGAIVNPTCGVVEIGTNFRGSTSGKDMTCTRSNNALEVSAARYTMDVQQVQASEVPLLRYFVRYVQEGGGSTVTLVTRTYS